MSVLGSNAVIAAVLAFNVAEAILRSNIRKKIEMDEGDRMVFLM